MADTKTGTSLRPLSRAACDLLRNLPRIAGEGRVFPGSRGATEGMTGFPSLLARMVKTAALPPDVTAHVLRHSFASAAADLGFSESTIGALIGRRGSTITARYTHHADAVLLAAADRVAEEIASQMGDASPEAEIIPMPARTETA